MDHQLIFLDQTLDRTLDRLAVGLVDLTDQSHTVSSRRLRVNGEKTAGYPRGPIHVDHARTVSAAIMRQRSVLGKVLGSIQGTDIRVGESAQAIGQMIAVGYVGIDETSLSRIHDGATCEPCSQVTKKAMVPSIPNRNVVGGPIQPISLEVSKQDRECTTQTLPGGQTLPRG